MKVVWIEVRDDGRGRTIMWNHILPSQEMTSNSTDSSGHRPGAIVSEGRMNVTRLGEYVDAAEVLVWCAAESPSNTG